MKLLLKLAWRNIWRNKRRSFITIAAVFFAVLLAVAMRGLQLGTYEVNIKTAVRLFSGYLQIQKEGYKENPSLRKSFRPTAEITQVLEDDPAITG
ncbi:MAG: ABC transporter permease, partial [Calditrichae bacterium]|nr:ABC transporter permease [Calditrichia bacterium]